MQTRLLRYFIAVANERHFARAAERCNVTQPTLSAGLAALETQLGKRLVVRDRRFVGLTAEGEAALTLARQIVAAEDELGHAVEAAAGPLRGEFRLASIPAAMPVTGRFAEALRAVQTELTISVRSMTSREIQRALSAFELDAGITYLDHEPLGDVVSVPLYAEHYVFIERADGPNAGRPTVNWADAAKGQLCLLHQGMQNRRILDARMAEQGLALRPVAVADSYVTLLAMVQTGRFCSIIPDSYAGLLPVDGWGRSYPLIPSAPASRIGLVTLARAPLGPLALLALDIAHGIQARDR